MRPARLKHRLTAAPLFASAEENVFAAFRPSLCSIVFSALAESNASLQVTATSVLALLAQQNGEWDTVKLHIVEKSVSLRLRRSQSNSSPSGLLLDSDIALAVDHLTNLLLTEEDDAVRSSSARKHLNSCTTA